MNELNEVRPGDRIQKLLAHELRRLHDYWWCFLALGALLVLCGTIAIVYPFVATEAVVAVLGAMLLISGVATVISSFWTGQWSAFLLQMLVGVLYAVVGLAVIDKPLATAGVLTLFIGAFAIVVGTVRVIAAMTIRFPQWGWALLNGAVTALFGVLIYRLVGKEPAAILWIIGLMVGIELLLNGWTWVALSLQLKQIAPHAEKEDADATSAS
ncbi:MAG: HdeD family acid-resistance protein [Planctomycetales bacterium]|nr:HdeD family acid-resistance protein [Planctomycetales bacterium]